MLDNNYHEISRIIGDDPDIRAIDNNLENLRQPYRRCNQGTAGRIRRLRMSRRDRVGELTMECFALRRKIIDITVGITGESFRRSEHPSILELSPSGMVLLFQFYNTVGLVYNTEVNIRDLLPFWIARTIDAPRAFFLGDATAMEQLFQIESIWRLGLVK